LALLGIDTEPPVDVESVCRLLDGVLTRGGHARRVRLENCGVAFPVWRTSDDVLAWERRGCRDRFCPPCAHALSVQRAKLVRDYWETRRAAGARGAFITLTHPKYRQESPRDAVNRVLAGWRVICNGRSGLANGILRSNSKRVGPPLLPGGLRSVELTARAKGTVIGRGTLGEHEVKVGGTHAHLHIVAELGEGVTMRTLAARLILAWKEVTGASPGAQDVQPLDDNNIYQAVKYSADFGALAELQDIAPAYARSVAIGLHGKRTCEPWGTWRGILKPPPSGLQFGDRSIASLVMQCEGRVVFGKGRSEPATEILASIAAGAERYKDLRQKEVAFAWDLIKERLERERDAARAKGLLR